MSLTIKNKIPAYNFTKGFRNTKEEKEDYKENTIVFTCKSELIETIKKMKNQPCNKDKDALFVLDTILNDERLLNKTKIATDGSYRNCRIHIFDRYSTNKRMVLDINWIFCFEEDVDYFSKEHSNFVRRINKNTIMEVLYNIEEIFLQP